MTEQQQADDLIRGIQAGHAGSDYLHYESPKWKEGYLHALECDMQRAKAQQPVRKTAAESVAAIAASPEFIDAGKKFAESMIGRPLQGQQRAAAMRLFGFSEAQIAATTASAHEANKARLEQALEIYDKARPCVLGWHPDRLLILRLIRGEADNAHNAAMDFQVKFEANFGGLR